MTRMRRYLLVCAMLLLAAFVYWHGLRGGYVFDDYPNILDNGAIQIQHATPGELARAALSSPSSDFRRPLASLTFALNYLATGLHPWPMKFTNLMIHLVNGLLLYGGLGSLLRLHARREPDAVDEIACQRIALMVTACWLVLPINLTAVLYVVQRMESLAQVAVLAGLWGYLHGRKRMLDGDRNGGLVFATASLLLGTAIGALAKESAVMLPMYAFLVECTVLRFSGSPAGIDRKLVGVFAVLLFLPAVVGLAWLVPKMVWGDAYYGLPYTLGQRLLTEPRILMSYLRWILIPDPRAYCLYHDDIPLSTGLLSPASTLAAIAGLLALLAVAAWWRKRRPLLALGILWYFAAHLLTATIVPLELVFEHRNYFASIGVLLFSAVALLGLRRQVAQSAARNAVAAIFLVLSAGTTWIRAEAWSDPLVLAVGDARRHPDSPRANYEAARTMLFIAKDEPGSRMRVEGQRFLERAAALPGSSAVAAQGLIYAADRIGNGNDPVPWKLIEDKLRTRPNNEEDASSIESLTVCRQQERCHFDPARLQPLFDAALSHHHPAARVLARYGDYVLWWRHDNALAERYLRMAVDTDPSEPAYHIALGRLLAFEHRGQEALGQVDALQRLNTMGRMDDRIQQLEDLIEQQGLPAR